MLTVTSTGEDTSSKPSQICPSDEPELNAHLTANSALAWQTSIVQIRRVFRQPLNEEKIMRALRRSVVFVISFALVGGSMTAAFAETQWERNHPRRDQVNDRLANQNRRIDRELKEGEISKHQARQLHREGHAIRQEERDMARVNGGRISVNGGRISKGEQKVLNQQENEVSRQIGR
jgi:hypothetical protein